MSPAPERAERKNLSGSPSYIGHDGSTATKIPWTLLDQACVQIANLVETL